VDGAELDPATTPDELNRVQGEDNCLSELIPLSRWLASEAAVTWLMELLKIETGNYRRAQKQFAMWTEVLAPPIVVNTLEGAEEAVMADYKKLHNALNQVVGKTIVVA
jgi:hypothetical protein